MPTKCESCRHYGTSDGGDKRVLVPGAVDYSRHRLVRFCSNDQLCSDEIKETFPNRKGLPLDYARGLCDREHDGHFVYFEPRDPSAGVTFRDADRERPPAPVKFRFADDEDRPAKAMRAAA